MNKKQLNLTPLVITILLITLFGSQTASCRYLSNSWGRVRPKRIKKSWQLNEERQGKSFDGNFSKVELDIQATKRRLSSKNFLCLKACRACNKYKMTRCRFLCKHTSDITIFRRANAINRCIFSSRDISGVDQIYISRSKLCDKICFKFAKRNFARRYQSADKCKDMCVQYDNGPREFRRRLNRGNMKLN